MITITCDMCGEKLTGFRDTVEVDMEYDTILPLSISDFRPTKKQLCVTCANKLIDYIDNQAKEGDE